VTIAATNNSGTSAASTLSGNSAASRSLSAMSLNEGHQFSPDEIRTAKQELDARTRVGILHAFQQSRSSGDPRAFSIGLIQQ
jgi:hypothetical protein